VFQTSLPVFKNSKSSKNTFRVFPYICQILIFPVFFPWFFPSKKKTKKNAGFLSGGRTGGQLHEEVGQAAAPPQPGHELCEERGSIRGHQDMPNRGPLKVDGLV